MRTRQTRFLRDSISHPTAAATLGVVVWLLLNLLPISEVSGQSLTTLPATDVTSTNATLNGICNPHGNPMVAWFEWGIPPAYGPSTGTTIIGHGSNDVPFSVSILNADGTSSAAPGTTYHFRAWAYDFWLGTAEYANEESFTTLMPPLSIVTGRGYWQATNSTLSYTGGGVQGSGPLTFILLQSADPAAPLSVWTRVATNNNTPGSFPIPPMGTAGPTYYRVKSE
jgi:hypothetical protein